MDLGALDLLRDRERGIPPYNTLRAEIGLGRFRSFDEMTADPAVVALLREAYGVHVDGTDRVEDVDLLVGTLCEAFRPTGFGFGETLFQVRSGRGGPDRRASALARQPLGGCPWRALNRDRACAVPGVL